MSNTLTLATFFFFFMNPCQHDRTKKAFTGQIINYVPEDESSTFLMSYQEVTNFKIPLKKSFSAIIGPNTDV